MSQVNKFHQINNPDYIYFDLQQANIYNTTDNEQQPLKFLETREMPIVQNTGDYYMSVARFQLDTYNLPVLVGEPDLAQTGAFDPTKTIYKIGMSITKGSFITTANVANTNFSLTAQILVQDQGLTNDFGFDVKTANTGTKNDIFVAVSDPNYNSSDGTVFIWKGTTTTNSIQHRLDAGSVGLGTTLGINNAGTRAVASSSTPNVYLFQIQAGVYLTTEYAILDPYPDASPNTIQTTISGNGNNVLVARAEGGSGNFMVFNFINQVQIGNSVAENVNGYFERQSQFSTDGNWLINSGWLHDGDRGYVEMRRYDAGSGNWIASPNQFTSDVNDRIGNAVAISGNGIYACASTFKISGTGDFIRVWKRTVNTFAVVFNITGVNSVGWGYSISMNNDGSSISVSAPYSSSVYIYKRGAGVETYSLAQTITPPNINPALDYAKTISLNASGDALFFANSGGRIYNYNASDARPAGTVMPLPYSLSSVPTIESVKWIKDEKETATAPTQNSLTGRNTALYPYYYCNSYNNFITMLNKALKSAYKTFIERIYNDWILVIGDAGITNQFLDIVAKHYPTPPFFDWNATNLTANAYVTLLFETYQSAANTLIGAVDTINYSMPSTTWATVSTNYVATPVLNSPLKFEVAFNAPLYSLFNSLPVNRTILTNSATGLKETYYTLNFTSSGLGLINPSPSLNSVIPYSFLTAYTNASTGVITIPNTNTKDYSHSRLLIKQSQEISTIDTWTPVNAIVFTTTSIPIVVNQFSASSSIGSNPPSSSLDNAFAFIITDLQTNQQGYRPNLLYVPTPEYRRIDLTGNQPLKNIDINVFWRTKIGNLVPFTLASGAMSSIKLLFEKKLKAEKQKISMNGNNVRDVL